MKSRVRMRTAIAIVYILSTHSLWQGTTVAFLRGHCRLLPPGPPTYTQLVSINVMAGSILTLNMILVSGARPNQTWHTVNDTARPLIGDTMAMIGIHPMEMVMLRHMIRDTLAL